jgi:hypothetical protein
LENSPDSKNVESTWERPTEQTKTNDEGLPKSYWQVSHDKIVAKDYFTAEATRRY